MNIFDYIKKHGLVLWQHYPSSHPFGVWMPSEFVDSSDPEKDPNDRFEIYADPDCTHFVSINTHKDLFRIIHREMVIISSPWQPVGISYEVKKPG